MTIGKTYEVLGIEADDYRIINDINIPYLYSPDQFEVVDSKEPEFWFTFYGDDGERYSYPEAWNHAGFFEDFFDGVEAAVTRFWSDCERLFNIDKSV